VRLEQIWQLLNLRPAAAAAAAAAAADNGMWHSCSSISCACTILVPVLAQQLLQALLLPLQCHLLLLVLVHG
jgi:hypothetical protein